MASMAPQTRSTMRGFGQFHRRLRAKGLLAPTILLFHCALAHAFAEERIGPTLENTAEQTWWQAGLLEMAKDPSRVYAKQYNFYENIYFDAKADELTRLLNLFAAVSIRDHVVTIKTGPNATFAIDKTRIPYIVFLHIPDAVSMATLQPQKEWLEPYLIVYIDESDSLPVEKLPDKLIITSDLPPYVTRAKSKPTRTMHLVQVRNESGEPAKTKPVGKRPIVHFRESEAAPYITIGAMVRDSSWAAIWLSSNERGMIERGGAELAWSYEIAAGPGNASFVSVQLGAIKRLLF